MENGELSETFRLSPVTSDNFRSHEVAHSALPPPPRPGQVRHQSSGLWGAQRLGVPSGDSRSPHLSDQNQQFQATQALTQTSAQQLRPITGTSRSSGESSGSSAHQFSDAPSNGSYESRGSGGTFGQHLAMAQHGRAEYDHHHRFGTSHASGITDARGGPTEFNHQYSGAHGRPN